MSRTIKFAKAGGPEVLEFIEMEVPAPGLHEIRIKVKAIGINRAESMWRNDRYVESPIFPAGLGYDCAGVVDAVGKDVTGFAVGDTVSTIPAFSLNKYSTYGEVILAPDHAVVKHPASLSFVEAASVWMMFITAYGALVVDAHAKAGDFRCSSTISRMLATSERSAWMRVRVSIAAFPRRNVYSQGSCVPVPNREAKCLRFIVFAP
jgi:NADPH:quinone reductase-like Zn-dependent oxidoreductase